jgi:hypothetical protein
MINALDAQLRDMFAIHRDLFDKQEAQLRARTEKTKTVWECNNYDCSYKYKGEFMGKTHLPDTDCPECGYHDSMSETGREEPCGSELLQREKRSDPSERNSVQKQYDRMGKYASNLHRSRMRANRGSDL